MVLNLNFEPLPNLVLFPHSNIFQICPWFGRSYCSSLYFEMGQRNLKLFKWEGFQLKFKNGLTSHSLSFKIWRSHFISSLESPWVAWSLNYLQMRFNIISNGNTFGKVLLFPLIQLSKVSNFTHFQSINHTTKKLSIYYNIPKFRILGCYR